MSDRLITAVLENRGETEEGLSVLNPWLFRRLQAIFGHVNVASQGIGMTGGHVPHMHGTYRERYRMGIAGEYYRVDCPFCIKSCGRADTQKRLWIHHRYGIGLDDNAQDKFWWAAHCFNEECLTKQPYQKELRNMIFNQIGRLERQQIVVSRGIVDDGQLFKSEFPGTCISLDALGENHHANIFLRQKGMDPHHLAQHYKVRWCQQAPPPPPRSVGMVQNRIVFPIYMHGEMCGWQGRYIGDFEDWKGKPSKYFTQPGCHVGSMLYGFDDAVGLPFCIVVEGVTDVIAMGAGAVATFGKKKTLSNAHYNLITQNWPCVVLLMDADAYQASELLYEQMRQVKPVVHVQLEDKLDPAEAMQQDANAVWDLIVKTARYQGVSLTDGRPILC